MCNIVNIELSAGVINLTSSVEFLFLPMHKKDFNQFHLEHSLPVSYF